MKLFRSLMTAGAGLVLSAGTLCSVASAQQSEPGAANPPLSPASAAPQTHVDPNLRTDSKPRADLSESTDSGPVPETLGVDATPSMDLGPDWSVPSDENEVTTLKIITLHKGVIEQKTYPAKVSAVTNPPEPPTVTILNLPQPPMRMMPLPPDPLAALPQ